MSSCRIGEAAQHVGMSADTLRYYERIGLMRRALRDGGGRRAYTDAELERLRFIKRAQAMDFKLAEIRQLLELRDHPPSARVEARRLAHDKLAEVIERLRTLRHLRDELRLLLNLCLGAEQCPILELNPHPLKRVAPAIRKRQPAARHRHAAR
ncbi:MAG: MerR family transcriptional regulator [Rhodanobacteraceae bacterium]|nr:MAG: MerR family transcriptional regulator [Rhodanobacteraceae bacterium]